VVRVQSIRVQTKATIIELRNNELLLLLVIRTIVYHEKVFDKLLFYCLCFIG